MKRRDDERLLDIREAIAAIRLHLERGALEDGLVFDAVRMRVLEIGEAASVLSASVRALEPEVPWSDIVRMRNILVHRYFDTAFAVVQGVVRHDLDPLDAAAARMLVRLST